MTSPRPAPEGIPTLDGSPASETASEDQAGPSDPQSPAPGAPQSPAPGDPASPGSERTPAPGVDALDSPESIAAEVSAAIRAFLESKDAEFRAISPDAEDISSALVDFTAGGKRIRPVLLWWGYQLAAGAGFDREDVADALARAAGSLELLHAAALIHDDVIDHSDTRRGRPALHRQFAGRHADLGLRGDADSFGISVAIVIGDICLALSEELFESAQVSLGTPESARALRAQLRRDVMVGQFLDVRAEVMPLDDDRLAERAWEVLSFKSAKYSVEQPLLLGAALAGADGALLEEISRFGLPLGQAFQLRDDVLGVFGDPSATGKPAGDDIREGKRTVLIAESMKSLSSADIDVLSARLGDPGLTDAEVRETMEMLTSGLQAVESAIGDKYAQSVAVLDEWAQTGGRIGPRALAQLTDFAHALSFRQS
ncbi:geranylgeranyl diphosphate synthase type I [Brevibacterium sanguinis]|uniref:Geranylgeranyl diphosphate synthase type I n=2 Tax=Brevibacterium TaxID=1696 RepID=A0A366ICR2_9MICO|nr:MULTISPECIES: polyprenyl synthetase family protein [Brevibacterium]RBP61916.1 geranylgeranyl diphosphate synthase type I [Brevibacterium sanguinis]RBP68638.1 geranylgeranyl diphosphate synthase type I [Brevibacterium celere]